MVCMLVGMVQEKGEEWTRLETEETIKAGALEKRRG